jgi:hypothetical protein
VSFGKLYIEGGGDSKEGKVRCREGFRKLLEESDLKRMPRLVACGGRDATFDDFKTAHTQKAGDAAMLIDSEDPIPDRSKPWAHLKVRDGWERPEGTTDEQVLFMATCMETWIVADRSTLRKHYGHKLQESALPSMDDLENRARRDVQDKLEHATRECSNRYSKGKRSFEVLAKLDPEALSSLPGFARAIRILKGNL